MATTRVLYQLLPMLGVLATSVRGQITQGPATAKVGGWLIEAELAGYARDQRTPAGNDRSTREFWFANTLVSTGLTESLDLQFGFDGWSDARVSDHTGAETTRGFGDTWVRCKWNFAGQVDAGPAWALLPYVKLPTAGGDISNGQCEPGVAVVFGRPLPGGAAVSAMLSVDALSDELGGRSNAFFFSTAVCSAAGWYGELTLSHDRASPTETPFNLGLGWTFELQDNLSGDVEVLGGVNREAGDLAIVARIVWQL